MSDDVKRWSYPHMCRDGHAEIGFRDDVPGQPEEMSCPVCHARAERDALRDAIAPGANRDPRVDYLTIAEITNAQATSQETTAMENASLTASLHAARAESARLAERVRMLEESVTQLWHAGSARAPLHEFLRMTESEYGMWVEGRRAALSPAPTETTCPPHDWGGRHLQGDAPIPCAKCGLTDLAALLGAVRAETTDHE